MNIFMKSKPKPTKNSPTRNCKIEEFFYFSYIEYIVTPKDNMILNIFL